MFAESRTIRGIHKQILRHVYSYIELLRNPQLLAESAIYKWNPKLQVESANCKWNPQTVSRIRFCLRIPLEFADSTYNLRIPLTFCGISLQLRNPERLATFACCRFRNKTNVPTKFTLQLFVRGIHKIFVSGTHLHIGACEHV